MKHLYILRHGKSSWASEGQQDADRPLTPSGMAAAARLGAECARRGWQPALALVSTAQRARRTFEAYAAELARAGGTPPAVQFLPALYLATPEVVLAEIARHGGDAASILVVGHNPGLHELALRLARESTTAVRAKLGAGFASGTLARAEIETDTWTGLAGAVARLTDVVGPKELDQS
jgi:phosphohistidine phosphatase